MRRSLMFVACAAVLAGLAFTQSTEPKPAFEVADIRATPDGPQRLGAFRRAPWIGNGRYEIRNASLLDLIATAYGVDPEKILGGPNWLEWDHFDITAKVPADSTPETQKIMLQTLLADRFRLAVHNDTRELTAYALTAGKTPKLKRSEGPGDSGCRGQLTGSGITPMPGGGFQINSAGGPIIEDMTCHNMTMEAFAQSLVRQVSQDGSTNPVTDETELKGAWDFEYKTTLQIRILAAASPSDTITIFDAVEKQLGLKLTPAKVPLPVVVVDSAQKPTPNAPGVEESLALLHAKEFDVADVKPTEPGDRSRRIQITRGGGVNFENLPLQVLITQAYGIDSNSLVSAPGMQEALQNHYTIVAKPPASTGAASAREATGPANASPDDSDAAWLAMRALLADRFKLAIHQEERQLTAWRLVAVKPKMKKAEPSERMKTAEGPGADGKDPRTAMPSRRRLVMFQNVTMAEFADKLEGISDYLRTPVVDATRLEGSYDFTVNFSPVPPPQGVGRGGDAGPEGNAAAEAAEPNGAITLFEAIEQQLGLRLVEEKRAVPVYVIDHVEAKPTDN